jgi:hypothetical protein
MFDASSEYSFSATGFADYLKNLNGNCRAKWRFAFNILKDIGLLLFPVMPIGVILSRK